MVQINLKLKLSKIRYGIKVSYNTFEKATYDQYLMSSLALRSKDETQAYQYIDEITGSGSLNAHFKQLYDKAKTLTDEQLKDVMNNSMYPMLRIDKSNSYVYYPQLDISVFNNKIYTGDFGKYEDLIERLYIQEKVIESEVFEKGNDERPEPYSIQLDNDIVKVKIVDEWIPLDTTIFQEIFVNDLSSINKFEGKVHDGADGSNWFTLTNSVINNMYSNNNYFYEDGDHCLIRNEDVRKTIVSQVAGFYIYKEEIIPYTNNEKLCKKVLDILKSNKSINEFKTKSLITLLTHVNDDLIAQSVINYILARKDSKELAIMGIELLNKGIEKKWEDDALKCFMNYADSSSYSLIYKANPKLIKDIQTLTLINPDYLTAKHKKEVEEYKKDKQAKLDTIKSIVGEITASGIREKMKQLKASTQTKRFSTLANKYIGHSKFNYEEATPKELDKYLKEITEMYDLMKLLKKELILKNKFN